MADVAPSRSAILELRDERQAMVEGHAFLDEKCLAIAAEIVKELSRYLELEAQFRLASATGDFPKPQNETISVLGFLERHEFEVRRVQREKRTTGGGHGPTGL